MAGLLSEQSGELEAGLRAWPEPEEAAVDLAGLDAVVADTQSFVATTQLLPDEATRQRLAGYTRDLTERREQLLSPLQIAIVGGTGVGKSTLLNALAGEPIVRMSDQRPCTQEVSAYVHEENELVVDPAAIPKANRHTHDREPLRDKILIDTPDYDSIDREHRKRLAEALRSADVVLWVTTAEKYADLAGANWMREYGPGRLFVFLLNRADEGIDESILDDVRRHCAELGFADAPLMLVSARRALEAKQGLGEAFDDEFGALEALLEQELDAKRMRAIKEGNYEQLVQRLVGHVAAAVPADGRDRLRRWREAGESAYDELHGELTSWLAPRVEGDKRLEKHIEYWFGTGFAGPVGGVLTLLYGLRAALSPVYPKLWQVSEMPDLGLAEADDETARLAGQADAAAARLRALGTDIGLPGAQADTNLPAMPDLARDLDHRLRRDLGAAVRAARLGESKPVRWINILLNTPTLILLIGLPSYLIWDQLRPLYGLEPLLDPGAYLQSAVLAVLLWLAAVAWLGQVAVGVRTRRFLERLRTLVGRAVDEVVREPLLGRLERYLDGLAGEYETLWALRRRAGGDEPTGG